MQAGEAEAGWLVGMHGCRNRDPLPLQADLCVHIDWGGGENSVQAVLCVF